MSATVMHPGDLRDVSTLKGTAQEVRRKLEIVPDEQVVAVVLPHASESSVEAIEQTVLNIAQLVPLLMEEHQNNTLRSIVEALVPKVVPAPNALREAKMLARARAAVIKSGDWMTAAEIASIAGFSSTNPSAQPSRWKRDRSIFAITHNGVDYFPSYGLDPGKGYRPLKELSAVLDIFDGNKDAWGLAFWFMSPNSYLGGKRPQDLLAAAPSLVMEAARDEQEGVVHG